MTTDLNSHALIVAVVSCVAAETEAVAATGDGSCDTDGQLNIGTILPVTGDLAFLGPPEIAGADLAVRDINEAGGVLGYYFAGHPYKIQADYFRIWTEDTQDNRIRVQMQVAY